MDHIHGIYDSDAHFIIDPVTRTLRNQGNTKTTVIQFDHNSERLTFELPRLIEQHDMTTCGRIRVHYINVDTLSKEKKSGIYDVTDLQVSQTDETKAVCSWLISRNATQLVGVLAFALRLACVDEDGEEVYGWSTARNETFYVSKGVYNNDVIAEEYADVLDGWEAKINSLVQSGVPGPSGKSAYEYALDGGYAGTEQEFAEKLAEDISWVSTDCVKSVNGTKPDKDGNVALTIPTKGVQTVNGQAPDENGNVEIEVSGGNVDQNQIDQAVANYLTKNPVECDGVKTVNGITPDENGNVEITVTGGTVSQDFDIKTIGKRIVSGSFSRILLLGDSITDGYGGTGYNGEGQRDKSINTNGYCWANLFMRYIYNRYGIRVERYGFYGSRVDLQYNRISNVVKPGDLVIWLSGTNNRNSASEFSAYGANIASYVRNIQSKGAVVLFMPCIPATDADEITRYKTTQDINELAFKNVYGITHYLDMNSEFMRYCEKNNVTIADTMHDKLHPNDTGYLYIFLILCRELGIPLNFYADFSQNGEWWTASSDPIYPDEPEVTLASISATYSGGSVPVGTSVNDLTGIVVTAHFSNGSTANVTGYTLYGTIAEGVNTITVSYGGHTCTIAVTGVADVPDVPDVPDEPEVTLESISATYSGGSVPVGTPVNALTGIVVTAHYSDGTSETVTEYTLSGTIEAGSNIVTVSYVGKSTTFTVNGDSATPLPYYEPITDCVSECNVAIRGIYVIEHEIPVGTITKVKVAAQKEGTYNLYFATKSSDEYTLNKIVPLTVVSGFNEIDIEIPIEVPSYIIATDENGMYARKPSTGNHICYQLNWSSTSKPLTIGESGVAGAAGNSIGIGIWVAMADVTLT
jgi:lysophospholipase L1-like esterase